ncbi:unnamed protein product [Dovyalis caffra]|uniref:Uncharacterized protein n=1 Tax=Dovyalis caffra TaxID=77055 RepID=A0AAV1QZ52_9ROSI|nr:unnamed protein product [Dovyalis caffra]
MECNKEEAIRMKDIANRKIQNGYFKRTRKIALKEQQLYPELENISQMLRASEYEFSGLSALLRRQLSTSNTKILRLLHLDKNIFASVEAAFMLIGEVHRHVANSEVVNYVRRPNFWGRSGWPERFSSIDLKFVALVMDFIWEAHFCKQTAGPVSNLDLDS